MRQLELEAGTLEQKSEVSKKSQRGKGGEILRANKILKFAVR